MSERSIAGESNGWVFGRFSNLVRAKRSLIRASVMQGVGLSVFALLDYRD